MSEFEGPAVGGPRDGEWLASDAEVYRVPITPKNLAPSSNAPRASKARYFEYRFREDRWLPVKGWL